MFYVLVCFSQAKDCILYGLGQLQKSRRSAIECWKFFVLGFSLFSGIFIGLGKESGEKPLKSAGYSNKG